MSKCELFISTLKMEQEDIVPFFPRDLTLAMDELNVPTDKISVMVMTVNYHPNVSSHWPIRSEAMSHTDVSSLTVRGHSAVR